MSANGKDYRQWVRSAVRHEIAFQSPECPEPGVLLDLVEQGNAHRKSARLLDHLLVCPYCRGEYTDLRRMLALRSAPRPTLADIARSLPVRVRMWARELIAEGITTPVASVRAALQHIDRLVVATSRSVPSAITGVTAPFDLQPAFTAIRSGQPTLRWSSEAVAQEYEVVVLPQRDRRRSQAVWTGSAGAEMQIAAPEAAGIEAGGAYLWQVIAYVGGSKVASPPAGFVVLTDAARHRVEALEQEIGGSPLGLIGLYETYGLYEEALQQAELLFQLNPEDAQAAAIRTKLLQQLSTTPIV